MDKKKIYLVISSFIKIVLFSYMIVNAKNMADIVVNSFKDVGGIMPESELFGKMIDMFSLHGVSIIRVLSLIGVVITFIILSIILFNKNYARYKGLFITLLVVLIFINMISDAVLLLSIIDIIVISKLKSDKVREKLDLPVIEREDNKKSFLRGIIVILIYFVIMLAPIDFERFIPSQYSLIFSVVVYLFLMVISYLLFKDELRTGIKLFVSNFKAYCSYIFPRLGKMYIVYFISAAIVFSIFQSTTVNQNGIYELPKLLAVFLAVIYAPLVEEVVFRGGFRKLISNDKAFIIVSGLIFGIVHTVLEDTVVKMFVMAIPYATLGGFFAYLYTKTNNITSNIFCHMLHNLVASIIILIM